MMTKILALCDALGNLVRFTDHLVQAVPQQVLLAAICAVPWVSFRPPRVGGSESRPARRYNIASKPTIRSGFPTNTLAPQPRNYNAVSGTWGLFTGTQ
jgi:hypothetical protein